MTIFRHQVAAELIDLSYLLTKFLCSGARSIFWGHCFPRHTAYHRAADRLRYAGILAYRRTGGRPPELRLTSTGHDRVSEVIIPERFWTRRWDGLWYLLAYDVPETQRRYRSALWYLLARLRLGCLQKSVWISARDIRPLFYDLQEAAAIKDYAVIFAARSVLDQSNVAVARQAWDFERLHAMQQRYLQSIEQRQVKKERFKKPSALLAALRFELAGYLAAMRLDPLLPAALWPEDYLGPKVAAAFRRRIRQLALSALGKLT